MLSTFFAVSSDITCSPCFTSISCLSPVLLSIVAFTNLGVNFFPLFAIVDNIVSICIGVTSNLWPNDIVASSTGPTFSFFKNILPASPGKSIPVLESNPNFSKYL